MKIMIDAGHGYETAGKRSPDGMREYEFNRDVAKVMKLELEKYKGVTVYFAHEDNRDVPLNERTAQANRLQVDVYFSIHANALAGKIGNHGGIETYVYLSKPKEAYALAKKVQSALVKATGMRDRGVKLADLHVLRKTNMTAILAEHGFMDSLSDLPRLKSSSFRTLCGKTNAIAVAQFYGLQLKENKITSTKKQSSSSTSYYKVQVGAFSERKNAEKLADELKKKGYETYIVVE